MRYPMNLIRKIVSCVISVGVVLKAQHRIPMFTLVALVGTLTYGGTPSLSGVSVQQMAQGNGQLHIQYSSTNIESFAKDNGWLTSLKVRAIDRNTSNTYTAKSLSGDCSFSDGTHDIVWDMDAEGVKLNPNDADFVVSCETNQALYCIIDLSAGPTAESYPVAYTNEIPYGTWTNFNNMTKMALRYIPAGSFIMGDDQSDLSHRVTLTSPFYIGVLEMTKAHMKCVTDASISGLSRSPATMTFYDIRGATVGLEWPLSSDVDANSFIGMMRSRTGLLLDLPTEAQWEYACRAGTSSSYYWGDSVDGEYMYIQDSHDYSYSGIDWYCCGSKKPNGWGIYDMSGSMTEWCLDRYVKRSEIEYGVNPVGSSTAAADKRVVRGGSWWDSETWCTSFFREGFEAEFRGGRAGARLVKTLSTGPVGQLQHRVQLTETEERHIRFDLNGGSGQLPDLVLLDGSSCGELPTPSRTGYNFSGWYSSATGGYAIEKGCPIISDLTVYARWTPISYSIFFHANGGTGTMPSLDLTYGVEKKLTACTFIRGGYSFVGWATSAQGGVVYQPEESISNLSAIDGQVVELYACWNQSVGVQLWKDGPVWAFCNIGATVPEECGYYFWWGDTVGYVRENNNWVAD